MKRRHLTEVMTQAKFQRLRENKRCFSLVSAWSSKGGSRGEVGTIPGAWLLREGFECPIKIYLLL